MFGDNRFDEYTLVTSKEVGGPMVTGAIDSLRFIGWTSLILSILWLGGIGSAAGAVFGLIGVLVRGRVTVWPVPGLRLCVAGLVIGVAGFVATAFVYLM